MDSVAQKVCSVCGEEKPLEDFYLARKKGDYRFPDCKRCKIARTAKWREEHPNCRVEQGARYREKYGEHNKALYAENHLGIQDRRRARYEMDAEESKRRVSEWRQNNPVLKRAQKHRRRARLLENGGTYSVAEWESIKTRQSFTCLCCKRSEPEIQLTVDHVLPLVKGGRNDAANIQGLCFECNNKKSRRHIDYRPQVTP